MLATTEAQKVLADGRLALPALRLPPLPDEVIIAHLRRICTSEGIKADDAALAAIARAATGAMRDALGLLDQLSAYGDSEEGITADTVRQVLGAGGGEQVLALVDAIAAGEAAAGLRVINAVIDDGADARQFAAQVVEYLRALLHAAATPARGARESAAETPVAPEHLEAFTLGEIAALVKRFSQVDYGIRHSVYGHLPLELCLIDCILVRTGAAASAPVEAAARPAPATPRPLPNRSAPRPTSAESPQPERAAPSPPERLPTPIRPEAVAPTRPAPATPPARVEESRPDEPVARAPEPAAAPPESPRPLAAVPTLPGAERTAPGTSRRRHAGAQPPPCPI